MITLILIFLIIPVTNQSVAPVWSANELARANTASAVDYLTDEEKKTIMLVNLARMDGKKYLQTYFQEYNQTQYSDMKSSGNTYMISLKDDMDKVNDLIMLKPDEGLYQAARYHAKDSGKNGIVGHTSSNGTTFGKRLPKYVDGWNKIAENCSYGYNNAAQIVGQLLLDEGVPSLGHRKSILSSELEYIGVSIAPHSQYRYNCVMDFCAKFDN